MKTCQEWYLAFNQYYNNITSNRAPGLEPVEISRFLTDAQKAIVVGLYNGTLGDAFESTEQATSYLAPLVGQEDCVLLDGENFNRISSNSKIFELPQDLLFITMEICYADIPECGEKELAVTPVTQDEYWRTKRNPFKGSNKRRVLRLSYGESFAASEMTSQLRYSEIISDYDISRYVVRYIKCPSPIILEDLSLQNLSIDGQTEAQTCALPEALHQIILAEAVRMAKVIWNN